jgi:site-specific recombinase XerD
MTIVEITGGMLRAARSLAGLSQQEVADRASISRPCLTVWEGSSVPFPLHPHMLRHACGYKLANDGHDTRALQHYLGHKNIQHTVRYSELSPERFRDFWKD